jgi:hypothetical protein
MIWISIYDKTCEFGLRSPLWRSMDFSAKRPSVEITGLSVNRLKGWHPAEKALLFENASKIRARESK